MSVKVLIERKFKEEISPENLGAINGLRMGAMAQPGYVSGETLVHIQDPREMVVVSTWSSYEDWHAWSISRERAESDRELEPILAEPSRIRAFSLGSEYLGKAFKEYVHKADAGEAEEEVQTEH
jgi:heme-degrading monooxygenase HmoA